MCGICGVVDQRGQTEAGLLEKMRDTMVHRGPDDAGLYISPDRRVGLAHRRLSIIDLSQAGRQPMANEDETVWVSFNGEIYNFLELRHELLRRGHHFTSNADTEVIVHLYEEIGEDFILELDGQFAIALWDQERAKLLLARDHFGKKPLYYRRTANGIAFASEIKSLLADPGCPRQVDEDALFDYLTFQYVPHPTTIFQGISKLPPGHLLTFRDGEQAVRPYWSFVPSTGSISGPTEIPEESIRETLEEAVRRRLVADVPVGVFLSGGVDSSAIVAAMAQLQVNEINTFSVGFANEDYDETAYAAEVAERYHTRHRRIELEPTSALQLIPIIARQFDEPLADQAAVPTYLMCRAAREHVKVCLSGEGGDEVFAGYPRYELAVRHANNFDSLARGEARARRLLEDPLAPVPASYAQRLCSFDHREKARLLTPSFFDPLVRRRKEIYPHFERHYGRDYEMDYLQRLQYLDLHTYLTDNLLVKVDRASMLASLEVRAPMLDRDLVRLGVNLHPGQKASGDLFKLALKKAMQPWLPAKVLWRPKMGFSMPLVDWFRNDLAAYTRESILDDLQTEVFVRPYVEKLLAEDWVAHPRQALQVWTLLMYQEWRRAYL